ncbi:Ger(x)C family spore germination protein [Sutcliffiella deserti]|uniref:Ger(x)C family spore germination protein n=1 Tax=Sutcliffiella deserti TaxID=2875501 RepID=UPI001CBFB87D|nr:Ger(x)C family spore germination protein [Sutcliffiella deserti]
MHRKIVYLLSTIILLTGCLQQKPLEELGLITAVGYDKEEDLIRGSIVYYEFDPLHPNNTKMVSSFANTSKGVRQKENLTSSRKLVSGQLRVAVYGQKLAEEGIISYIDTLSRDSEVGTMSYLAITNNTAYELFTQSQESEDISNAGTFMYDLIRQNVESESLISPTLHEFMQCFYSEGMDPVLPYIQFMDDTIAVKGTALLKDDRMIATIDTKKSFYLKLLMNPFQAGGIELSLPTVAIEKYILDKEKKSDEVETVYVSLDHLESEAEIALNIEEVPTYTISVDILTRMQEITEDYDLGNPEALKAVEKAIAKEMKKSIEGLIKECQELGVDPVGFGNRYRAKVGYRNFSKEEWREIYSKAKFNVSVKTVVLRTGVMD